MHVLTSVNAMRMWQDWVNAFLGVWLVALAFLGVTDKWTLVVVGAAVALLGFWAITRERFVGGDGYYTYRRDFGLYGP
jgi:hypothetical protein